MYSPYKERENANGTKILGKRYISKETKGKREETCMTVAAPVCLRTILNEIMCCRLHVVRPNKLLRTQYLSVDDACYQSMALRSNLTHMYLLFSV